MNLGKKHTCTQSFLKIAVENMANAIKKISVQRGYDVTNYALQCFGGAGGQHACLIADVLGIQTVLIHPFAGVLSAYGIGLADVTALREKSIELALDGAVLDRLQTELDRLAAGTQAELRQQDIGIRDSGPIACGAVCRVGDGLRAAGEHVECAGIRQHDVGAVCGISEGGAADTVDKLNVQKPADAT